MRKKVLVLSLYLAAITGGGQTKELPYTLSPGTKAAVETFLKCSARTRKADSHEGYCNTKLHIPSDLMPEMRRCLANRKIAKVEELPSFVIPGKKSYQVEFRCTPSLWFTLYVEGPEKAKWIEGIYAGMP